MTIDPWFYVAAVPAVLLSGSAKGGFGGGLGVLAVPLMALVISPLAPIGVYTGVWLHRHASDRFFVRLVYVALFIVGCKLLYDGIADGL